MAGWGCSWIEPAAVVIDLDAQLFPSFLDPYGGSARASVSHDIGECLTPDPE